MSAYVVSVVETRHPRAPATNAYKTSASMRYSHGRNVASLCRRSEATHPQHAFHSSFDNLHCLACRPSSPWPVGRLDGTLSVFSRHNMVCAYLMHSSLLRVFELPSHSHLRSNSKDANHARGPPGFKLELRNLGLFDAG